MLTKIARYQLAAKKILENWKIGKKTMFLSRYRFKRKRQITGDSFDERKIGKIKIERTKYIFVT